MKLSEEQRKRWALKFVLWAMDALDLEPASNNWSPQKRKDYIRKCCNKYIDKQTLVLGEEIDAAIELVETHIA